MFWMKHTDHGVMPAYDTGEKSRLQAAGWTLLNEGESPNLGPKAKPFDPNAEKQAALHAALSRLSEALEHPNLDVPDGVLPAVALIDFAVSVLSQKPGPAPVTVDIEESRDEMAPERKKPGRKPKAK